MRSLPMLLLAGAIAVTACAPAATIPSSAPTLHLTTPRQIVRVSNHGWDEIELIAMRGGTRRILGVVSAAQQTTLVVSEDMLDTEGTLQLAARTRKAPRAPHAAAPRPERQLRRLVARKRWRTLDGQPFPTLITDEKKKGHSRECPGFLRDVRLIRRRCVRAGGTCPD